MYKILVSGMAYDGGKSGISDYMRNVITELGQKNKIDLVLLKSDINNFPLKSPNIKVIPVCNWLRKPLLNMLWHLFIFPLKYALKKYDFVFLPAANRRIICCSSVPVIATFHDLSQFHVENKYDRFRMFYIKKVIPYYIKKFEVINSISENTKKDLMIHYNVDEKLIRVNHNGFDRSIYFPKEKTEELPAGIKKKYFLYIARIEHPGKNHLRLIKAYEALPNEIKKEYDLVFTGKLWSGGNIVIDYYKRSADSDRIHFLGFVESEVMPVLYRCCSLYIFPSLYEGFGIPLLEAMASGVPVICSSTSSLPEIGGDAVVLFDPLEEADITASIVKVLKDKEQQQLMIERGLIRVSSFSWTKHADNIINYFKEINGA